MSEAAQKIPYAGFRFVSAVINGGIWFGIGFGISMGVSGRLAELGRFGPAGVGVAAAGVVFLAALFGRAGAQTGFLNMASSGRVALPDPSRWGEAGSFDALWPRGVLTAAIAAPTIGALTFFVARAVEGLSRTTLCLLLGAVGATFGALQSALLSGPRTLGDLRPTSPSRAPDLRYLSRRVALPQALGNGAITALIAYGTFSAEAGALAALAPDAALTALIIGAFMLTGSSGIVATDRKLGRVGQLAGPAPSKLARAGALAFAVALAGALGAGLGAAAGTSLPQAAYVAFKGLLGAAVAFGLALPAGRVALAS